MPRAAVSSGKKHPSPRFNSMAVKDGRLLEGPLGRDPFARFETPIEQGSKASQKAQKRFATPKEHGTAGQIVPSKGSWSWRRQLLNCLPVTENRPLLMLRCLGRFPLQWQRQGSADTCLIYNMLIEPRIRSGKSQCRWVASKFQPVATNGTGT